jgi:glycosyltransferase involved in cell wall biosynthesis
MSIVTPSYDQAEFLETALRSVVTQDYPCLEYIVLDGSSTDGSVKIIEQYADRIDFWRSGPDNGQADAINRGWARAGGDVVGWLNSDDRLEPKALFHVGEAFAMEPSLKIVYGDCRIVDAHGQKIRVKRPTGYDERTLLLGGSLPQPSVFIRRSLAEELGGLDSNLEHALDWAFFLRAFLRCSDDERKYLPTSLSASREYEGTKTRTGLGAKGRERRKVLTCLRDSGELDRISRADYRRAVGGTYWIQAVDEWLAGRYLATAKSVARAVARDPGRLFRRLGSIPWLLSERRRRSRERPCESPSRDRC